MAHFSSRSRITYREAELLIDGAPPPDDPRLHVVRARALAGLRRNTEADDEYALALKLRPDDPAIRYYGPGSFSTGWTHLACDGIGNFLFYNSGTGEAADGHYNADGLVTKHYYPPGSFGTGWTHITGDGLSNLLFYNAINGEAADGRITDNGFVTKHYYAPGSFATGWTHVVGR